MAKATPSVETIASENNISVNVLAQALTQALEAAKPKAKITVANRVAHNPMNPENRKRVLRKDFYQNFTKVDVEDLTDEEFDLIHQLKEGNFIPDAKQGFLIEVIDVKRGSHRGIHVRYNNASIDQRMQMMTKCPDLATMFKKCIAEAEEQKIARKARRLAEDED